MGAAASVNVDHIPGIKEAYEAKKAEGKKLVELALVVMSVSLQELSI